MPELALTLLASADGRRGKLASARQRRLLARRVTRLGFVAAMALVAACSRGSAARAPALSATVSDSAGVRIAVLNQSPSDVSRSAVPADTLRPNLDLVSSPESFDAVTDVTAFRDGRIAVLDREREGVFTFTPDGQPLARLGRAGDGPGEFRAPVAIAALGNRLVVLQARLTNTLVVFDSAGRVASVLPRAIPGDWLHMMSRAPTLPIDVPIRTRAASEDVTRRLGTSGDTAFVVQQQPEEDPALTRPFRPQAALLRYDAHLQLLDTLAVVPGVLVLPGSAPFQGAEIQPVTPLFFARSVWALGAGWVATGHGRDTTLHVLASAGPPLLEIRWPRTSPPRVSSLDRLTFARWVAEYAMRDASARQEARISAIPKREVERQIKWFAGIMPFADEVPELMAAYAAGACLWLSGFAPADYIDGTSLTWIGIDVRNGRVWKVIRIPRHDGRVRHMDATGAYVSYRDSLGLTHLERYAWGSTYCDTALATVK